jgi:poly-gamma-glutamate capsule biosynthesis protein CapA/YwtB (metallophosphatase superfamily)
LPRLHQQSFIPALLAGLVVAIIAGATYSNGAWWRPSPAARAAEHLTYWVEGSNAAANQQIDSAIRSAGYVPVKSLHDQATISFTVAPSTTSTGVLPTPSGHPVALGGPTLVATSPSPTLYASLGAPSAVPLAKRKNIVTALANTPANPTSKKWTLAAVGDIGLGRSVYTQMATNSDFLRPFSYYRDTLRTADLAIANLECALSDDHAVVSNGGMTFVAPFAAAAGLKDSGLDAVSVANNHSFNAGAAGYRDTLRELGRLGIAGFGGGLDSTAAHTASILTTGGVRVALLGYSSIIGSTAAGANSPGMAYLSMAPWGQYDPSQADAMAADIRAARSKADVVIVYYHWGTEYTHDANADQRTIAHRAIEAGADVVLGAHPHWVQGVEWYRGHLIAYSLGNFIFDQDFATETKQGTMLQATFEGKRLISAGLVPYEIHDNMQPQPAGPAASASILADVYSHSWW